jgi:type II secretory pathway component GspD/PulD (secretin)
MERISEVVKAIDQVDGSGKTSKYYPLNSAEPTALARALTESFPKAKIGADSTNGGIFVTGTELDHEAITKVVQDVNQQPGKLPSFKAFPLQYANPETLAKSLTTALGARSTAGITFNREAKSVFAVGSKQDLSNLEQMISQMDTPESRDNARRLEIFSLKGVDGKSVATSLESLFKDSTMPAEVKFDQFNQQLFVTGDAKQMALVSEALKKITPAKRDLEVFQLENADPNSIRIAAEALFSDEPMISMPNITTDTNGTREQI